jgi:murein tripeptide amidase MpaA
MKALLEDPALAGYVRPIRLAHPSLEGRDIEGVEIAKNVNADDGRPVFLQMGVHHAREWPSGEHAIEFGIDLLNNRDATAVQFADRTVNAKELIETTRTIVVPIVNPDGFNLSREADMDGQGVVNFTGHSYKRKNCRIQDGLIPGPGECGAAPTTRGVDPNRNYGQFWGGPGASGSPTNETYWGAAPFSEPEIQGVRELVSQRHVASLITNHTFSELVLRPPGLKSQGEPFDEDGYYKPLGDAMAAQNGYASQYGYELYDTTGTTEDWSYAATGGLGFTFEIGGAWDPAFSAGFHPAYPVGVPTEYFGKGQYALKGNRSAYFLALEFVAETANHSLIEGRGRPGAELRLTKTFSTLTSPRPENGGQPIALTDSLVDTLGVGTDGTFSWHVNPSTRPMVAKGVPGREVDGRPQSAPRDFEGSGTPFPPNEGEDLPGTYEEVEFSIPASEDNGQSVVRMEYPPGTGSSDLDLYVYRRLADGTWEQIGSGASSNGGTNPPCTLGGRTGSCDFEEALIPDLRNGEFKIRVVNYESTSTDWVARLTTSAPVAIAGTPPAKESYTLSCIDQRGKVLAQRAVTVDRGERVDVGDACKKPKR